jgi:hypothetical protein
MTDKVRRRGVVKARGGGRQKVVSPSSFFFDVILPKKFKTHFLFAEFYLGKP